MVIIKKILFLLKFIAYGGLAIMLYLNVIGPEKVAKLLEVKNPSTEGLEIVGVLIPTYVLYWTICTVFLEVVSNVIDFVEPHNGWK